VTSYVGSFVDIVTRHTTLYIDVLQAWDVMLLLHHCKHTRPIVLSKTLFCALVRLLLNHLSIVNLLLTRV